MSRESSILAQVPFWDTTPHYYIITSNGKFSKLKNIVYNIYIINNIFYNTIVMQRYKYRVTSSLR